MSYAVHGRRGIALTVISAAAPQGFYYSAVFYRAVGMEASDVLALCAVGVVVFGGAVGMFLESRR